MIKTAEQQKDFQDAVKITANKKGILPLVVEKDFWIVFSLKKLFSLDCGVGMVFKGGTSLSKAYNLIYRMSEDCDITVCRADLGFVDSKDPVNAPSRNKREKLLDELKVQFTDFLQMNLIPNLISSFSQEIPLESFEIKLEEDGQSVRFYYPRYLGQETYSSASYIRPSVLFEFGIRGDVYPVVDKNIVSYIEEELSAFQSIEANVKCLAPTRTFWEKATLLHAEYYRPNDKRTPERLSRHYYDIFMLEKHGIANESLNMKSLLEDVIKNKTMLFPSAWAKYDLIRESGIKLLPSENRIKDLSADYKQTRDFMVFGEKPTLDDLLQTIGNLESRVNASILGR